MSKDKPEVGDVFLDTTNHLKLRVLYRSGTPNTWQVLGTDGIYVEKYIDCVFWGEQYKYLGHSKANIDDLFKTENEE